MKSLKSYIFEAGLDKDLIYDILISVIENERTVYDKCCSIAAAIAKKAKQDIRPNFNHLVESSTIDKLAVEVFKIYVAEYSSPGMRLYSSPGMRLGTQERKELKKWLAARVFHILNDELKGLTPEEIKEFENNPYFNSGDFNEIYK